MDVRRRTGKNVQTNRGSKRICQERFICEGDPAELECCDCDTRQCRQCEQRLHASARLSSHFRREIEPPSYPEGTRLCGMWCYPYNVAEFQCLECKNLICVECNRAFHRGKLSKHHRTPLPKPRNVEEDREPIVSRSPTPLEVTVTPHLPEKQAIHEVQSLILDVLPPPLAALPKPNFITNRDSSSEPCPSDNETESAFFSLEDHSLNERHLKLKTAVSNVASNLSDNDHDPFVSIEPNPSTENNIDFYSGHFSQDITETITYSDALISNKQSTHTDDVNNPEQIDAQKNMELKTPQDFCQKPFNGGLDDLAVPEFSEIDRGFGGVDGRMNFTEDGLKISGRGLEPSGFSGNVNYDDENSIENNPLSLNSTPPSSLESDPGSKYMYKQRKEARVKAIQRNEKIMENQQPIRVQANVKNKKTVYNQGFLLVDDNEEMQVSSEMDFLQKLKCSEDALMKVISIFGNTGDGKSYTLNHTFFDGCEVFTTSDAQDSCTMGVWAAYHKEAGIITIDTEGLLGSSKNENQRMRLLLKILALSDVVIYRTCADRLHLDLYRFLGDASEAYTKHFQRELQATLQKCNATVFSSIGPAVIVFQETKHTLPLGKKEGKAADTALQEEFQKHNYKLGAFSCVHYVGTQTVQPPTDFTKLKRAIMKYVEDRSVRSPRHLSVIYQALKVLNSKFSGEITKDLPATFPDEYFTCPAKCLSCHVRCTCTMNHLKEGVPHSADARCKYEHQYDNKVFICKSCHENGDVIEVVPKTSSAADPSWFGLVKYAWSGYVLECPRCGIIYRSRERWYGNLEPEITAVRTEIRHVWPGGRICLQGTHNAARKLVDGLSHVVGTISSVSAKPTKVMSQWMSDQIAPVYWRANAEITICCCCNNSFEDSGEPIHHCRACGDGVCDECSQRKLPVPERGWGETAVRVCENCFTKRSKGEACTPDTSPEDEQVTARYVGEVMQSTFTTLGSAVSYPLGYMVSAARPAYWIPDEEIKICKCCKEPFGPKLKIHHCRACGHGVCDQCSLERKPVPSRGWDESVRVCSECSKNDDPL